MLQVVVVTDCSLEEAQRIDEICRKQSPAIAFIRAETRGVFANVFCDFGPSFNVIDVDGGCYAGSDLRQTHFLKQLSNGSPRCTVLMASITTAG